MMNKLNFGIGLAKRLVVNRKRSGKMTVRDARWITDQLVKQGPLSIKFGQFISSRGDIFDPVLVKGLSSLQDNVPPMERHQVQTIIESLRASPSKTKIQSYDPVPLASASIGQVHKGVLCSGQQVAIKIKRPQIADRVQEELDFLQTALNALTMLATLANDRPTMESLGAAKRILGEFCENILLECDYENEVKNMVMYSGFDKTSSTNRRWITPVVFDQLCTEDAIVMQYLPSRKLQTIANGLSMADRKDFAFDVMDIFMSTIIENNVIHSDFQPGNVGVDEYGQIIVYDFGNVIRVPPKLVVALKSMIFPLMEEDVDGLMEVLKTVDFIKIRNEPALRAYIAVFLKYVKTANIQSVQVRDIDAGAMQSDTFPAEIDGILFQMLRSLGLVEGLCKSIYKDFTYVDILDKYTKKITWNSIDTFDDKFIRSKIKSDIKKMLSVF